MLAYQVRAGRSCAYEGRIESYPGEKGPLEVSFPEARFPRFPIATEVDLRLCEQAIDFACDLATRVIECERTRGRVRYRLQPRMRELGCAAPAFNRREILRVPADVRTAASVELRGIQGADSNPIFASLIDISATGASLRAPLAEEPRLCLVDRLRFLLRLAGDEQELELVGDVRYRELVGSWVRYGVEFVWEDRRESEDIRRRLMRYVREHEPPR